MPSQIAHIIAGEEALSSPDLMEVREKIVGHEPFFRLGCQGPDIFYHNQRTRPSGLHYGSLVHKRNYAALLCGALQCLMRGPCGEARSVFPGSSAEAYLLGLATHAAVDRVMHPWIIYFSGWYSPKKPETARYIACHAFLERLVDVAILRKKRDKAPGDFDIAGQLSLAGSADEAQAELTGIWAAGLRSAFPVATSTDASLERRIENAFSDARHFFESTNPFASSRPAGNREWVSRLLPEDRIRVAALLYPDSLPADIDIMNIRHATWFHPSGDGRSSTEDGFGLFDLAIARSSEYMRAVLDCARGVISFPELRHLIGDAGLGATSQEGLSVPSHVMNPLPLRNFLEMHSQRMLSVHGDADSSVR